MFVFKFDCWVIRSTCWLVLFRLQKSNDDASPVAPWILGLFVFVVCGSGKLEHMLISWKIAILTLYLFLSHNSCFPNYPEHPYGLNTTGTTTAFVCTTWLVIRGQNKEIYLLMCRSSSQHGPNLSILITWPVV